MKIFIVAGEASGDLLGAKLLADLRALAPNIEVRGIGGDALAAQHMQTIFPMSDLSLIGIAEVLPKISLLLQRLRETEKAIREFQPDVVLTIDVPDFSKRLARRIQDIRGKTKLVHYVAPTVWVWRPGRAKTMAALFDHLFCLYPFEPPYFERVGLSTSFVGHPVTFHAKGDAANLRAKLNIRDDQPVICLLPGSRKSEIEKLLPVFLDSFRRLQKKKSDLVGLMPTLPRLHVMVAEQVKNNANIYILPQHDKWDAFALAAEQGGAIAASGTVSLELAQSGCAHIIAYKINPISAMIVRMLSKLPHVNLVNILAGRTVVPEYLQEAATVDALSTAYCDCIEKASHQQMDFAEQLDKLKAPAPDTAARALLDIVKN